MLKLIVSILIFLQQGLLYLINNYGNKEVVGKWYNAVQIIFPLTNIFLIIFAFFMLWDYFREGKNE